MPVDPQAQAILATIAAFKGPSLTNLVPAAARAFSSRVVRPGPDVAVREHALGLPERTLRARSYRPHGATGPLPCVVYFHAGGFVVGSLDGCDALCRQLALDAGCMVVSVDYRLAPEHKFPAAAEDAFAATCWVAAHATELDIDATCMAVAGESAGGNLAAVTAALCRVEGGPALRLQVLLCPVTDLRSLDTQSYRDNAEGYLLTQAMMVWFRGHYLNREQDADDARCSPLARRDLSGLAPALVLTAEYDPLRDEGEAYARALAAAGVPVRARCYPGMIHTFVNLYAYLDAGRAAVAEITTALRHAFIHTS